MKRILIALAFLTGAAQQLHAQDSKGADRKNIIHQLKQNNMKNQATQVVQEFLTAVQQGNTQRLGELLHPDVKWEQPGNNRFSGSRKNLTEVFQMVGGMFGLSANTLALTEIKTLAVNGNSVACLIHWQATKPAGGVLDVDNIDVYTVEDGKIVKAVIYTADAEQEDAFWGR